MIGTLLGITCLLWAQAAMAQAATVSVERENFRAAPDGVVLAEVLRGTSMTLEQRRGGWGAVLLEGWIWEPSVREEAVDGHDLVVSAPGGENLRLTPNGDRLARLRTGMRLDRIASRGSWIQVRRQGWIWLQSVEVTGVSAAQRPAVTPSSAERPTAISRAGQTGAALLGNPGGDTLAVVTPGAELELLSREGNWARVRATGWVWVPLLAAASESGTVLTDISAAVLAENADSFRGRVLEWTVQFISLERAERIRTDFYEGEPFILARGPGDEPGFVYIAVAPDQLGAVQTLAPLQRIRVRARVRTGRSTLMNAPVLDLVRLEPVG